MSTDCLIHLEEVWKQKTKQGNQAFDNGNITTALYSYEEALIRAEILTGSFHKCLVEDIPFSEIFAISCLNIAQVYVELNKQQKAKRFFERGFYYLIYLKEVLSEELAAKIKIQPQLQHLFLSYTTFLKQEPAPDYQEILSRLQRAALS